ncbi:hypothetical protein M3Y94_01260900 [Aphelenchoides besseyi]|nr:hypothetical protein M3Y94_01260900 [Aphelenchoides besseyi]KAI6222541.1 hypothetical protein M3Y95_00904400 [Aphelenchoides besseyi]
MVGHYDEEPLPSPPQYYRSSLYGTPNSIPRDNRCTSWNDAWRGSMTSPRPLKTKQAPEPTLYGRPSHRPYLTEFPISTIDTNNTKTTTFGIERERKWKCGFLRDGRRNALILTCVLSFVAVFLIFWLSVMRLVSVWSMIHLFFWFTAIGTLLVFVSSFWPTTPIQWFDYAWKISMMIVAAGVLILVIIFQFNPDPFVSGWMVCKQKGKLYAPKLMTEFANRPELVAFAVVLPLMIFFTVIFYTLIDCFCIRQWRREVEEKRQEKDERPGGKSWTKAYCKSVDEPNPIAERQSWQYQSTTTFPSTMYTIRSTNSNDTSIVPHNFVRIPRSNFDLEESTLV